MRVVFDVQTLAKNQYVYHVDQYKLTLTTELRIELFLLWRQGKLEQIEQKLKDCGLGPNIVGNDFGSTLITSFKNSGYPIYKSGELTFCPDKINEHPLIRSEKFELTERNGGIRIRPEFEQELFSRFPEISVEEGLKLAGIDPRDVGYQRVRNIQKKFEERAHRLYMLGDDDISDDTPQYGQSFCDLPKEASCHEPFVHPYIKHPDGTSATLTDSFYNETYLIAELGLSRLLEAYEIPEYELTDSEKLKIAAKLSWWQPTQSVQKGINTQLIRIGHARAKLLNECVAHNLYILHDAFPQMGIAKKRRLAQWIDGLPRDPWGYYTKQKILEMLGFAKSTYYALLHNENYGKSAERRLMRDDEDILLVRRVAEYKGFRKGYRQISMMMKDVCGCSMSAHRVLYLMRKYAMRTTIRRPGKNRKAMKELITKNGKPNLIMRRFKLHRPNEVRLTDVTYLDFGDHMRAYGSASIDPVTSKLICFVVSENNDLALALQTLQAMDEYPLKSGGIIHSDQGILYFTDDFQKACEERNLFQSMSRRANCWDNAPQESFFGHFKDECDYKSCKSIEELRARVDDYKLYYNTERRLWDRGKMTPQEYEGYLCALDERAFSEYMADEEVRYLKMKEASANAALKAAHEQHKACMETLKEMNR